MNKLPTEKNAGVVCNLLDESESKLLIECEEAISAGLKTFMEVGSRLLIIRDSRLYRQTHGTFEDYCQKRWEMTRMRASQLITAVAVMENVNNCLQIPTTESQVRPLSRLKPEQQREVWAKATQKAVSESRPVTARDVTNTARELYPNENVVENLESDEEYEDRPPCKYMGYNNSHDLFICKLNNELWSAYEDSPCDNCDNYEEKSDISVPHVAHNSGVSEWYTPEEYILAARRVLGEIDLDPASTEIANKTVKAKTFYTKDESGLEKTWAGTSIYLNPPYSQPLVSQFADKFCTEYDPGHISQAIVIVNNSTDSKWFRKLVERSSAYIFTTGRVKFLDPQGNPGAPLQGQAIIYFGDNPAVFMEEFGKFGWGGMPWDQDTTQ